MDGCAFPLVVALRMDLLRLSLISLSQSALVSLKATGSRLQYKTNLPKLMELDKLGRGCESCNFLSIASSVLLFLMCHDYDYNYVNGNRLDSVDS